MSSSPVCMQFNGSLGQGLCDNIPAGCRTVECLPNGAGGYRAQCQTCEHAFDCSGDEFCYRGADGLQTGECKLKLPSGKDSECRFDEDCMSNSCTLVELPNTTADRYRCVNDCHPHSQCESTHEYCDIAEYTCKEKKAPGLECSADAECTGSVCADSQCLECADSGHCADLEYCSSNTCQRQSPLGEPCAVAEQCMDPSTCSSNGICILPPRTMPPQHPPAGGSSEGQPAPATGSAMSIPRPQPGSG